MRSFFVYVRINHLCCPDAGKPASEVELLGVSAPRAVDDADVLSQRIRSRNSSHDSRSRFTDSQVVLTVLTVTAYCIYVQSG